MRIRALEPGSICEWRLGRVDDSGPPADDDPQPQLEAELDGDPRVRRLRALLHTQPVHALELNKSNRGKDKYAVYDLIVLQLEAIDYITDNMDPHRGVAEDEVRLHLVQLAAQMAPRRPKAEHAEVAAVVLAGLENEGQGRFLIAYSDPKNPTRRVQTDVELVRAVQGDDGGVELRATPQAINLLLDALDADIESAEDAMAFMFRFQFERGRLSKASSHAQSMRRLSISYREHIQQALTAAARDISQVDWSGDVMATIDRAYKHLEMRLREDAATQERVANQYEATDIAERRAKLAEIVDLLQDCNHRHRELHAELMDARWQLREHHARQRLAPPPSLALVDLQGQVLVPALGLAGRDAVAVLEAVAAGLVPPVSPGLVDLGALADHQWRPAAERGLGSRPVEPVELEEDALRAQRFPPEAIAAAIAVLARAYENEPLSRLLEELAAADAPAGTQELVALGALEAFMEGGAAEPPGDEGAVQGWRLVPRRLRAEKLGRRFVATGRFFGDDLRLTRGEEPR